METFGERLAKMRKARGLYQYELADKLEISKTRYSNYERDTRQMDQDMLVAVCKYLKVSSDYLLGLTNHPYTQSEFTNEEVDFMLNALDVYNNTKKKFN